MVQIWSPGNFLRGVFGRAELYGTTTTIRKQLLDDFHKQGATSVFLLGMPPLNSKAHADCHTCALAHYTADIQVILQVVRELRAEDIHL